MVQIAYSLMVILVALFLVQEILWRKLPSLLSNEKSEKYGLVKARTLGVWVWLSLGGFFFVLAVISAVCHLAEGVVFYFLAGSVFLIIGIKIARTEIVYTETIIRIHGPGIHIDMPISNIMSVQKLASRVRGTWYLLISFDNGQKIRFEQLNYVGLDTLYCVVNDFINRDH